MTTSDYLKIKREIKIGWLLTTIGLIASLILGGISLYYELNPPPSRAKLTIFIEHGLIDYGTSDELIFEVFGEIVNDSPLTAFIKKWDFFVAVNTSYQIVRYEQILPKLSLSPLEKTDFRMGRSLMGNNNTRISESAIQSGVVMIWYEDDIGIQQTSKEYSFAP